MSEREALKLALEALEVASSCVDGYYIPIGKSHLPEVEQAITAIKEALAQPEQQEPVAWQLKPHQPPEEGEFIEITARWGKRFVEMPDPIIGGNSLVRFYFDPPQRTWVGLTEREIDEAYLKETDMSLDIPWIFQFGRSLEAKLKEKNHAG